ncbi:MAG: OB-fold domain-containing protein [Novosphingobium sp.]
MPENADFLLKELRGHIGQRLGPVHAWDAVNEPMIRHWREALGFAPLDAPGSASPTAPATMLPVWLMAGVSGKVPPGSDDRDNRAIMRILEREGFVGILGTNCEQEYERPLRVGERISSMYEVDAVSERKNTKFGPGYFITFLQTFLDEDGVAVGTMRLRILRFKPLPASSSPLPPQPAMSADTAFFWEGLKHGKLLIQRCATCKTLRHPAGPACTHCHSLEWDTIEAKGYGELYSFVMVHTPRYEAYPSPHPVGLIELDEGVRLIAPLAWDERNKFAIGDRVKAVMQVQDGGYRMPIFHRAGEL